MKRETTAANTKKIIATSFKEIVAKVPFEKITVSRIVEECGINRKTFYYHFEDLHALVRWTIESEAVEVVKQFDLLVDYEEALGFVMDYVEKNRSFINSVYDNLGKDELQRFFYSDFSSVISAAIDGLQEEMSLTLSDDFKRFMANIYTEAVAGILVDWARANTPDNNQRTMDYLCAMIKAGIPAVLKSASDSKL